MSNPDHAVSALLMFQCHCSVFAELPKFVSMTLPCTCRRGENFSKSRHVQGTEVKAITYSAMQVIETDQKTDIYVIVDI